MTSRRGKPSIEASPAQKSEMKDAKEATRTPRQRGAAVTGRHDHDQDQPAFVADDQLKALKINVDTKDGKVVLTGVAPDAGSRDRATTMAKPLTAWSMSTTASPCNQRAER